jgi:hypothetical protein
LAQLPKIANRNSKENKFFIINYINCSLLYFKKRLEKLYKNNLFLL